MSSKQLTTNNNAISFFKLKPLVAVVRVVLAGGLFSGPVHAELPVPVIDNWQTSGNSDFTSDGTNMVITQHTHNAILNWQHYNVGANNTVQYKQPDGTSVSLNRIYDMNASSILGHITANGQVYLVNNNGFVFGNGAVVDASTFVASALNISSETIQNGLVAEFNDTTTISHLGSAALNGDLDTTKNATATTVNPNGFIRVDNGASIHVSANGQIILAAPTVTNAGKISGDSHAQIILVASKDKVYLQPVSATSPFAGLLVEVGTGGKVTNQAAGDISVREGNVTLAGFAVNQSGRISSTTSVNVNGSVRLLARENLNNGPVQVDSSGYLVPGQTVRSADLGDGLSTQSSVTFGTNSSVTISPDANSGTAITEQTQPKSYIEASGNIIDMKQGASIVAPSANVNFTALDNNNLAIISQRPSSLISPSNTGRIDLEKGSSIDVSGLQAVQMTMESNVQQVSVESYNLRDSPYQRGGVLQGETVLVDVRNLPTIIDAAGAVSGMHHSVYERMTSGGTINLKASGDVIVNNGASLNIAGGWLDYQSGYIATTQLLSSTGQLVDISQADPNQHYTQVFGTVSEGNVKWNDYTKYSVQGTVAGYYQQGYVQGEAAGTLNVQAPVMVFGGDLNAHAVNGAYQTGTPVTGGSFYFNQDDNVSNGSAALSNQNVLFQASKPTVNFGVNDVLPQSSGQPLAMQLSSALINGSGLGHILIKTGGNITVGKDAAISMPALSSIELDAGSININGSIHTSAGSITLNSLAVNSNKGLMDIAANSLLDVSGSWVNNLQNGATFQSTKPAIIDAGTIKLSASSDLNIHQGAAIKADGGAWLSTAGRLTSGAGGAIALTAGVGGTSYFGTLELNGQLEAYGLNKDGSLSVTTSQNIDIGNTVLDKTALTLGVNGDNHFNFSSALAFSTLTLNSNDGSASQLRLEANTQLLLEQQNKILTGNYQQQASADSIAAFSQITTLPHALLAPETLNLSGYAGITLDTGSAITFGTGSRFDANGTVNLTSKAGNGIYIDGTINALAGNIAVNLKANQGAYNSKQTIWLGANAVLNTQGMTLLNDPNALSISTGSVLNGGNVSLQAQIGYVVMEKGSQINTSGTNHQFTVAVSNTDAPGFHYEFPVIGSNAGNISITAAEGLVLDGTFSAHAGSASNSGGSLAVTLNRNNRGDNQAGDLPTNALQLNVVQAYQQLLSHNQGFGTDLNGFLGQATISSEQVTQAGFDNLQLTVPNQSTGVQGTVQFEGDVTLKTASSINIDAPSIAWSGLNGSNSGVVKLDTSLLELGSSSIQSQNSTPITGGGTLQTTSNVNWTQLNGALELTGFNQVNLSSVHDLRAVGVVSATDKTVIGELTTAANLNLHASQIYPSTLTNYTFNVIGDNGQITISGSNTDVTPLAADGKLTINAAVIDQNGVLKAPLGSIAMNASKSMEFSANSVTSVSADGKTIPFGVISNGLWEYPLTDQSGNTSSLVFDTKTTAGYVAVGVKDLSFNSPVIKFDTGSVVNVAGGGDLIAAEFQAGLGGSSDYLANSKGFAILPSLGSSLAPYDPNYSASFNYDPRTTVYLSGYGDLPAGFYTILPAAYAVLPGAYLVTPVANTTDQSSTTYLASGVPVVSGYETIAGTNIHDSRTSGFMVETSAQVKQHSFYNIQTANNFFTASANTNNTSLPLLPNDSGQISIDATTQLLLDGTFNVASAHGGKGAKMDISAPLIKVVTSANYAATPGTLELVDTQLNKLHIDSLLLGGTRVFNNQTGDTTLTASADSVSFDTGVSLKQLDLMAAAKNTVEVLGGADLTSSGKVNTGESLVNVTGDSALLRVSADNQITINHSQLSGVAGVVKIDKDANITASKSILLDGSYSTQLNGNVNIKNGSLSLAANSINLGNISAVSTDPSLPQPLNLSNDVLAAFGADTLILNSRSAINLYGTVGEFDSLGNQHPLSFNNLVLNTAALSGFNQRRNAVELEATNLTLENTQNASSSIAGKGLGILDVIATNFIQGNGVVNVDGFRTVNVTVANEYNATGNGTLNVAGNLNLSAAALTTTAGDKLNINATGSNANVVISGNDNTTVYNSSEYGGAIALNGNSITLNNANVLLPSGNLSLTAKSGDILVEGQSKLNLAGAAVNYAGSLQYTPGGTFSANAQAGKITLTKTTELDIGSGGTNAAGGQLNLSALAQSVELDGTLNAKGASATINVANYAAGQDFNGLVDKLTAAGVNNNLYFRVHNADIALDAGHEIVAKTINLVSDQGAIDIAGTLKADGVNNGGSIQLNAGGEITLENHSLLSAKVTNISNGGVGGNVSLSSVDSLQPGHSGINIMSGATIDVTGSNAATGGVVNLSALRTGGSSTTVDTGINIQPIAGNVVGYREFNAIGYKKYTGVDSNAITSDTTAYMAAAAQSVADLGAGLTLRPGVEIDYNGNLDLTDSLDLSALSSQGIAGNLIIAASGNLTLDNGASITDGFNNGTLETVDSWSMQLVAGADQTSADKFAVANSGDLTLGSGSSIHSGSGDIKLAAAGNIVLTDQTSTIYSAGKDTGSGTVKLAANTAYANAGGDIVIHAGGNVVGAVSNQFLTAWTNQQYAGVTPRGIIKLPAWGIDASKFQENIGSFGGGAVTVSAGGDITDLSVMMPTTGKETASGIQIQGGGTMQVNAAGNIAGGAYYLGMGSATLTAGGKIEGSANQFSSGPQILISGDSSGQQTVAAGSGDSQVTLNANQGVAVSAVSDAMSIGSGTNGYSSYTAKSGITINSLSGDIHLSADTSVAEALVGASTVGSAQIFSEAYPATLNATAFNGNVILDTNIVMSPSASGNLNLFAKQNVGGSTSDSCAGNVVGECSIVMSDASPANIAGYQVRSTALTQQVDGALFDAYYVDSGTVNSSAFNSSIFHALTPLHSTDTQLAHIVTQTGDVSNLYINLPKQAVIKAGQDMINASINIQQINATDGSVISAGRDFVFTATPDSDGVIHANAYQSIQVGGPGTVLVETGRNLDLGASVGIETVGNFNNNALSSTGASVNVVVGLNGGTPDYNAFINKYLQDSSQYASSFAALQAIITPFMQQYTGITNLSDSAALTAFSKLDASQTTAIHPQLTALLGSVFFNELKVAGSAAAADKLVGYAPGFAAIEALFPGTNWSGNITMDYSKIQTVSGGGVNLFVPGGQVNVGLAVAPTGAAAKASSDLGIVAQAQGDVNAFVKTDFEVNTSRVFTLGGGDILLWSSDGNIDAGKGAKTALAVTIPPPYFNSKTHQLVVPAPVITDGSGIRTAGSDTITPGNVYLFAPQGVVNAGEAGIGGTNVTIGATAVLGAQNIQVSGVSTGVPQASTGSLAAGLTGTSNGTAGVSQVAQAAIDEENGQGQKNAMKNAVLGLLSVDILGFGE
ncbi:filamentous haemagglutinin family protein [Methylomonas sp. AM2-LC]|uniref:filamentous haemagglutinin family protein n=1 Tax=Methylomonas sp. AM2-LC TaxID=3153301 RepID=UPI003266F266